jgi:broad specificity phosphatase PhoE
MTTPRREATAELWLVRHGETVGGSSTRLYGSTDLELSDVGRRQMEHVRELVAAVTFDRVIVSPLARSREAAAIVHPRAAPRATVIESFTEIDFGDWEGLTAEEIAARHPAEHDRWRRGAADQDWGFPGGESRSGFRARVLAGYEHHLAAAGGRSLLVLHKGVVKTLLGSLLNESPEVYAARPCELGCVHVVARENGRWSLAGEVAVDHLGPDRIPHSR